MSLRNIKNRLQVVRQNKGILATDQVQLVATATIPADSDLANGRMYYNSNLGGLYAYINSAWVNLGTGGAVGVTSWDGLYDNDKTLDVDTTALILNGTAALGANNVLTIVNAGSGKDIAGPSWSLISTGAVGILELTSGGTINATGGALTIGKAGTAATVAGTMTVTQALTATASLTITGAAGADKLTVTAGDVNISDGSLTLADNDEAASVSITNDTAASVNVIDVNADGITDGVILHLDSTAAGMTTGKFLECFNGAAAVFSVALYGATTIAGNAATNVFTVTAGDLVVSDGSLTITDADDAATLSITNNANVGTNASQVAIAGAGAYTGSTTKSFVTITPSGLTTGTAVYLPLAAMTTGKGLHIAADAVTTGSCLYIDQDGEVFAAGELVTILNTENGDISATPKTGNLVPLLLLLQLQQLAPLLIMIPF